MKVTLLGSGTSTGVPRITGDWGACDPDEPRNRRTRVAVVIEGDDGARLLIDTPPDLREQFLRCGISKIDGVFWTHDHADHCHGIDDLRALRYGRNGPIPGYGVEETVRRLKLRFSYVFAGEHGYPTIVKLEVLDRLRLFAGFTVDWCVMPHGPAKSTGFRFGANGKSIGYATDFSEITDRMVTLFNGADVLVCDCLRREEHPTHANLAMALELGRRCKIGKLVLTHLDKSMDYMTLSDEVPKGVVVGYDGLQVKA